MKKSIILIFVIILGLGIYIFFLLKDAGQFKEIHAKSFPFCKSLNLMGAEDIAEVQDTEFLVISSDPRDYPPTNNNGLLKVYSKTKEDFTYFHPVNFPQNFFPHGIDIKKFANTYLLAVVNHPTADSTTVETFNIDLAHKEIRFLKTYTHPSFTTGNDITILSPHEFLMSEDFGSNNHLLNSLTQYLRIATGSILHFNMQTEQAQHLVSSLYYTNGIAFDESENTVYVSEMLGQKLTSFSWNGKELIKKKELTLPHAIDNITLYKDFLLLAGHPKLLELKKMRDDRSHKSPSVVLQVKKDFSEIQEIYENNGSEIASSSVAYRYDNKYLIGSVFDNHVLLCTAD